MKAIKYLFIFSIFIPTIAFAASKQSAKQETLRIKSEKVEIFRNRNEVVFTNRVEAKKPEFTINCDKMIVKYVENKNNKMDIISIKLINNIKFMDEKNIVIGDEGLYDVSKNTIYLKNNIKATQGGITLFAEEFEYNVETAESKVIGSKDKDDRVTIIINNLEDVDTIRKD